MRLESTRSRRRSKPNNRGSRCSRRRELRVADSRGLPEGPGRCPVVRRIDPGERRIVRWRLAACQAEEPADMTDFRTESGMEAGREPGFRPAPWQRWELPR